MRRTEYMTHACDPKTLTVSQLMEDGVVTVGPTTPGLEIAKLLTSRNFGSVPVVEADRRLVGLVSEFDLIRAMDEGKDPAKLTAADIMTRQVVTVSQATPVADVIHLMRERHLIHVPVTNGTTLVGILARRDVLYGYVKAVANYWP